MLPEISRRCTSCGAAVRAGARFCPQCGKTMAGAEARPGAGGANDDAARASDNAAPVTRDAEAPGEWAKPTREFSAFVESLADEAPRRGEGPRADLHEGATAFAPDAREGGASRATNAAGADDAVNAGNVLNAGDVANSVNYANAGDYASAGDVARSGDFAGAGGVESVGDDARVAADDRRGRVARVREGARTRVGRMRDDALVVLEETPDDSGLRFVVVAAVLFVLFLFFLFLSTTVLR